MISYTPTQSQIVRKAVGGLLQTPVESQPVEGAIFEVPEEVYGLLDRISKDFGVAISEMQGRARGKKPVSTARQFAMWAICNVLDLSADESAEALGRNRTTVIHAVKLIEGLLDGNDDIASYVELLNDNFGSEPLDGEDLI